jgi:HSP20 family protein
MAKRTRTDVARWDPFREFSVLQDRMDRLFEDVFSDSFGFGAWGLGSTQFMPAADMYEDGNSLELRLEVPGVDEKDLEISLQDNVLTVKGERKLENNEKGENFVRQERAYGKFSRSFTLPSSVDPEHVNANYVNGVLHIRLGKRAEARPKQIKVNFGQRALESGAKAAA